MAVISTLIARMIADLSKWTPNMEKGKRDMTAFQASAKMLKGTLSSLGIGFSIAGTAFAALKLSQRANETLDLARGLGMSVESFQRLRYVMSASGGDVDALSKGLFQFIRRVQDGGEGMDKLSFVMQRYGLTVESLRRNPEKALLNITKQIDRLGVTTEVTSDMFQLFGRATVGLFPVLSGGADSFQKLSKEAEKYGVVLSEVQLLQAQVLSIQAAKGKQIIGSLGTKIVGGVTFGIESYAKAWKEMGLLGKITSSTLPGMVYWWHKAGQAAVELEEDYYKQVIAANAATAATTIWNKALEENAELLKDVASIESKLRTPQEVLADTINVLDIALGRNQITLERYETTLGRLYDEFERPEREKMEKWAEQMMEEAMTPMDKYLSKMDEITKLRRYFWKDAALTERELYILDSAVKNAEKEYADASKPESIRRGRDSFMEVSPLMSVSGLTIGKSLEQKQAADIAAIRSTIERMSKDYGLN